MAANKITVTITTGNAAFADDGTPDGSLEIARILRTAADKLEGNSLAHVNGDPLRDANGNTVGRIIARRVR